MFDRIKGMLRRAAQQDGREPFCITEAPSPKRGLLGGDTVEPEEQTVCIKSPTRPAVGECAVYVPFDEVPDLHAYMRRINDDPTAVEEQSKTPGRPLETVTVWWYSSLKTRGRTRCVVCDEELGEQADAFLLRQELPTSAAGQKMESAGVHMDCTKTACEELERVMEENADEFLGRSL